MYEITMHDKTTIRDQIKNCLRLAAKMDTVDEYHYDQSNFFDREDEKKKVTISNIHNCGTSACALGWAATMRYFQNRGIGYNIVKDSEWDYDKGKYILLYDISLSTESWDNALDVFGIDRSERDDIFGGYTTHNGTPEGVANALRKHAESLREQL